MKALYAIQGTGNGHLSRAMELTPYLAKLLDLDLMLSGITAELKFPYKFKYKYHGASFFFGKRGGVNYLKSFKHFKPIKLINDIRQCPIADYDLVINDFEPISAWAARRQKVPVIAVSHQAAFLSSKVPLPKQRRPVFEYGMKHLVAPSTDHVGLHYKNYDNQICLPIIRADLQELKLEDRGHITVYLPAFADDFLIGYFTQLPNYNWDVYSKKTELAYKIKNVTINPVDKEAYTQSVVTCHALLIGAGFQGTSEGLFLKKKMMAIPMVDQYEQQCNAAALDELGVPIVREITDAFVNSLNDWLQGPNKVTYTFQPNTNKVVKTILAVANKYV